MNKIFAENHIFVVYNNIETFKTSIELSNF